MRPEDIRQFLTKRPFDPFRMTLTDGRAYDIRHPELAMVGRSTVVVGIPTGKDPEHFGRLITVSLLPIMQLESLKTAGTF